MYRSSSFRIKDKDKWEDFKKVYATAYMEFHDEGHDIHSISGAICIPDIDNFLKAISELIHPDSACTILTLKHSKNCQGNYYVYGRVDTVTVHDITTIPFEDYTVKINTKSSSLSNLI